MREAASLAGPLGHALLALTLVGAGVGAFRRPDADRLNILAFVLVMAAGSYLRIPKFWILFVVGSAAILLIPFFVLRLARQFREVSPLLRYGSLAPAVIGLPEFSRIDFAFTTGASVAAFLIVLLLGYGAWLFISEAKRTAGLTNKRLIFASIGIVCLGVEFAAHSYAFAAGGLHPNLGELTRFFWAFALSNFYLAFNTPRRLRAMWQRTEQARYLNETAARDAEDRGWHAAADLLKAADRSVTHSLIFVALRPAQGGPRLVVRASSDPRWVGSNVALAPGTIARVVDSRVAEMGAPSDCAPDVADRIRSLGRGILVAPIATSPHVWGVVLIVQRRGSLFPEDDLVLIGQLGRSAATALDHAALVADARERERRRADVRLQAAEARMVLMLESIKDYAMFVLDKDGLVVTWHVGAEHVFGFSSDDMTGEPAAALFNLVPPQFSARLDEARQLGSARWEGPCRRQNGDGFLGATVVRPLAADSDIVGFVAITRDVTEQRGLEDRLRQSQKLEAIGLLAGGIAHDFNNMLLAIQGNADLLAADAGDDEEQLELLGQIQNAVDRAEALTRRLLAFGRRQALQPTVVSLSSLVIDILPMLRRAMAEHIEIVSDTSQPTHPVLGDRSQLEQILINLAVNARDAMALGGRLTLRTSSARLDEADVRGEVLEGQYALLEVSDTGIGMDAATRERIFEPFFTTKGFGYGTGLGLATVYGNVKQMGGLIRVDSEMGQGTTFRIYLPETHQLAPDTPIVASQALPRGHETILLVEDDSAVRTYLVRTLERQGYRVMSADHPAAALSLVETTEEAIDLVITDVVLPGLVGPDFVRALAELRGSRPMLPVLYISGYADGSPVWEGEAPLASHFLQKPFSTSDLMTRIRQILTPAESGGSHTV